MASPILQAEAKILVIQTAFLGDVILSTALLEKLHAHYPSAKLHMLVRKGNEGILASHPYLDKLLIWNKKENKYRNLFHLLNTIRAEKYDLVVNVQRFAASGFLTAFSGGKITVGFNKNPFSSLFTRRIKHEYRPHEVERNQQLIAFCTDDQAARPRLYPSEGNYGNTEQFKTKEYITIAPASVWFTKQFPPEKWAEFLNSVKEPLVVYLVGAPTDSVIADKIISLTLNPRLTLVNLCTSLNILDTAALFDGARMNYTNDSAPLHIASAMNAPIRAVFCSTIPAFGFGPLSDNGGIIETKVSLSCRPCTLHGRKKCPLGHYKCALTIEFSLND